MARPVPADGDLFADLTARARDQRPTSQLAGHSSSLQQVGRWPFWALRPQLKVRRVQTWLLSARFTNPKGAGCFPYGRGQNQPKQMIEGRVRRCASALRRPALATGRSLSGLNLQGLVDGDKLSRVREKNCQGYIRKRTNAVATRICLLRELVEFEFEFEFGRARLLVRPGAARV